MRLRHTRTRSPPQRRRRHAAARADDGTAARSDDVLEARHAVRQDEADRRDIHRRADRGRNAARHRVAVGERERQRPQRSLTLPDRPPPSEGRLMRANDRFRSQGCDFSPQSLLCSPPSCRRARGAPTVVPQGRASRGPRGRRRAGGEPRTSDPRVATRSEPHQACVRPRVDTRSPCSSSATSATTRRTARHSAIASSATTRTAAGGPGPSAKRCSPVRARRSTHLRSSQPGSPLPAPRDHPVAHLARRRHRSALRSDRPARVRRRGDDRRDSRLRHAGGEDRARPLAAAVTAAARYAASVWIGVWPGSISVAKPRSQVTKT